MADSDNNFPALLAAAVLGVGAGWLAATSAARENERRRALFESELIAALDNWHLQHVSSTFGRAAGNVPVWHVTYRGPYGTMQARIPLSAGTEPYAADTAKLVAEKLAQP